MRVAFRRQSTVFERCGVLHNGLLEIEWRAEREGERGREQRRWRRQQRLLVAAGRSSFAAAVGNDMYLVLGASRPGLEGLLALGLGHVPELGVGY